MNIKTAITLVVLGILFFPLSNFAQDAFKLPKMESVPSANSSEENLIFYSYEAQPTTVLNLKWENGLLYTTTNEVLYIKGRFAPQARQIQIQIQKKTLTLFDTKVKACMLGKKTYVQSSYMDGIEQETGYFELIANGPFALLKQYNAESGKNMKSTYFVTTQDVPAEAFKCKLKNILALYPSQKETIKKYIKDNRLNVQNEMNLAAIFDYANQLISQDSQSYSH